MGEATDGADHGEAKPNPVAMVEVGDAGAGHGEAKPKPVPMFEVGDVVIGQAKKWKDHFDQVECKIVALLTNHYKVIPRAQFCNS